MAPEQSPPDETQLALVGRILHERRLARPGWRAAEPGPAAPGDGPLVRFCRRMGWVPKSWAATRAAEAAGRIVGQMASASGLSPEEVRADLAAFCRDDGPDAICVDHPRCVACPLGPHCAHPNRRLTIKDLPASERPRERLLQGGEEQVSNAELLALIIGGGSDEATALDLAHRLLSAYGTFRHLARRSVAELTRVRGIGPAKAARIKAALAIARRYAAERPSVGSPVSGSRDLYHYMREKLAGAAKEVFYTILLDTKNRIIREDRVAVGSLSESVVHPREVFKTAISESAAKVIFVHNHPSGNPEPSPQDRSLTVRLCRAGDLVGIPVLDHLIVGHEGYFSFAEHGLLGRAATRPGGAP